MKSLKLLIAAAMLMAAPAYAGFQAINGTTNLGVFNKLTCSTGLTCTKSKDSVSIVSSPSITSGAITIKAAGSAAATVDIQANNNAANGDDWQEKSTTSQGGLSWLNNTSGSLVQKMLLSTGGNLTVTGTVTATGGVLGSTTAPRTIYGAWIPSAFADATSTTPSATTVYLTQIKIPVNLTITGVQVLNAATCGTNKYVVALFNDAGTVLANSATAGVLCSGTSAYQQIPFTGTYAAVGPRTYWIGVYMNGTTDRFYTIPALGQGMGLAGTVTGQTFGTVANVTLPTTFTAGSGVVATTY